MEVYVANVENMPEGCMLALTAGSSRRLAPLAAKQKFAFGGPAVSAAACDGGPGMKIEVLTIQGGARLDAMKLMNAVGEKTGAVPMKGMRFEIPLELASGPMKVNLSVRPAPNGVVRGGREAVRAARAASPSPEKKQRLVPVDDLAGSADEALGGADRSPAPPRGGRHARHRHNVALEARTYLEEHRILPFVEEMMRVLVKDRPNDPWDCISGLFPKSAQTAFRTLEPAGLQTIGEHQPEQHEAESAPAVQQDLGMERPESTMVAGVPPAERERAFERSPVSRRTRMSSSPKRQPSVPAYDPVKGGVSSFAHIEFCLEHLDYKSVLRGGHLLSGLLSQVTDVLAQAARPAEVVGVEVDSGRGSVVISAKAKCSCEASAEEVKMRIDADGKGFLHKVASAVASVPGMHHAMKAGAAKSEGLGARGLSTFVRQKLVTQEEETSAMQWKKRNFNTASTMAPSFAHTALPGVGGTQESWYSDGMAAQEATLLSPGGFAGVEERELEIPEAVCTSGNQVLRQLARTQFLEGLRSGKLHKAIESHTKEAAKKVTQKTKETLLAALRSGSFAEHLQKAREYKRTEVEGMRQMARSRILNGLDDGTLEEALEKAMGPVSNTLASTQAGALDASPKAGETMSRDEVRKEVKFMLMKVSHEKRLASMLRDWAIERHHLIHDPRPVPIEPFKDYFAEHFKWVYPDEVAYLYSSYERKYPVEKATAPEEEEGAPPPPPPDMEEPDSEPVGEMAKSAMAWQAREALPVRAVGTKGQYGKYISAHFSRFGKALPKTPDATPKAEAPEESLPPPVAPQPPPEPAKQQDAIVEESGPPEPPLPPSPLPFDEELPVVLEKEAPPLEEEEKEAPPVEEEEVTTKELAPLPEPPTEERAKTPEVVVETLPADALVGDVVVFDQETESIDSERTEDSHISPPRIPKATASLALVDEMPAGIDGIDDDDDDDSDTIPEPELADEGVELNLRLQNMDYALIAQDPELLREFEQQLREAIAAQAGPGVLPEHIVLDLSSGSIIVKAVVVPPAGFDAGQMQRSMAASPEAVGAAAVGSVQKIERIGTVCTGSVVLSDFSVKLGETSVAKAVAQRQVTEKLRQARRQRRQQKMDAAAQAQQLEEEARLRQAEKDAEEAKRLQAEKEAEEAMRLQAEKEAEEAKRLQAEKDAEEAKRLQAEKDAEEAKRLQAEKEAEEKRLQAEKEAEEAMRLQAEKEAEEAKRLQAEKEAEEAKRLQAEKEAEAEKQRLLEEELAEEQRKLRQKAIEEAAAGKLVEEELLRKQEEEEREAQERRFRELEERQAEQRLLEEELQRQKEEEELARRKKEAEDTRQVLEDELSRLGAVQARENEEKKVSEEVRRNVVHEETSRTLPDSSTMPAPTEELAEAPREEAARREAEAAAAEAARKAEEEATRRAAEEAAAKQAAEAAEAARKAEEEATRRAAEEAAAKQAAAAAEASRRAAEEAAAGRRAEEEARRKEEARLAEEAERKRAEEVQKAREEYELRLQAIHEEEQRKKESELMQVSLALQNMPPRSDSSRSAGPQSVISAPLVKPISSSDFEEIMVGDRVEVVNSLYVGQDGMEVLAGWQGTVEEINDGDAVILFYGADEGRYVLREDFGNLIIIKADPSVSSSSADVLANQCSEAVHQNEQLRAQNAALRVELDRLLAIATPLSTPPLTGASRYDGQTPQTPPLSSWGGGSHR